MEEERTSPERPPTFEDGQDIRDRAFAFGCRVVTFCQQLSADGGVGRLMVPQLLSCTLSCATMLEEAPAAESDADFISNCSISLKECRESWTRLRVCKTCQIGPAQDARELVQEGNALIAIVTTIIRNKRRNVAARKQQQRNESTMRRPQKPHPPRPAHEFQIPDS